MNFYHKMIAITGLILFICLAIRSQARDLNKEIRLQLGWRFEIGDNPDYAQPDWDDSDWEKIHVPGAWENQGFPGYDGFAWYRIRLKLPAHLENKALYLKLGYIDDVDAVYVNGKWTGQSGLFPPEYQTAYTHDRVYFLPPDRLRFGKENTIAVRVFDEQLNGGIVNGSVGIYSYPKIPLKINLSGNWKFTPGDDARWVEPDYNDSKWDVMMVPGNWEIQGYPYHDGYSCYRKQFTISDSLRPDRLILCLGLIDDADEVFFNGTRIGRTGSFPGESGGFYGNSWQQDRFYMIPPHLIRWNHANILTVRVYDYQGPGGIYDGPVGVTTKDIFVKYDRPRDSFGDFIRQILE
jgi:hypothetical protein